MIESTSQSEQLDIPLDQADFDVSASTNPPNSSESRQRRSKLTRIGGRAPASATLPNKQPFTLNTHASDYANPKYEASQGNQLDM